jgi:hypothetical protein
MIDYSRQEERIQMKGYRRTHIHTFDGSEHGQLLGESDKGVGRMLASIAWDGEADFGPVFSEEIEEEQ